MKLHFIVSIGIAVCLLISLGGCIEDQEAIVIGGKTFNEQYILPEIISQVLEEANYTTEVKTGLNSVPLYEGIKDGDIDIYVEYTGTAYSELLGLPALDSWDPEIVYNSVLENFTDDGIVVLFKLGFEDAYAIAVRDEWAETNNVTTISDLAPFAANMSFGSDLVFHERPDGLPNINLTYNITFGEILPMQPTLMYDAIKNGEVDAIPPYTTDSRIDSYNLRVLEDDKGALPPYEAILLISADLAEDLNLTAVLSQLDGIISAEEMRAMNAQWDIDLQNEQDIATAFLISEGIIDG